jgi:trimeric autotransporter adhesin
MTPVRTHLFSLRVVCGFFLSSVLLGGCSQNSAVNEPLVRQSSVHGGQQPVVGATLQLYAVGTTGDGSAATPLLTQTVISDANGTFSITGAYTCPSASTLVYITATGGNPGLSVGTNNTAIALMAALGPCGNLLPSTFVSINELSTVAAVWSLAPFMSSNGSIGSSAADAPTLASLFTLASEYVDVSTGQAPGLNVPAGLTVPVALLNTLADILSSCVNSAGGVAGDGSACGTLFIEATPNGLSSPVNVIGAGLNMANFSYSNVSNLFGLLTATPPFQPTLPTAPLNFIVSLLQSSGLIISPSQLTFPAVEIGVVSAPQTLTVANTGAKPISLVGLSISGLNASDFSTSAVCSPYPALGTLNASLAPGATCTVQILFGPTATGSRSAYLTLSSNAGNSPQQVALIGTGEPGPVPSGGPLTFSPSSLSFTQLGVPQSVILTNTGSSPVSISSIGGYQESDNCGTVLAAQSICTVSVSAGSSYTSPGTSGTVTVANGSAFGTPSLPWTAVLPSVITEVSIPPVSFGDWAVGTTSSSSSDGSIELSNTGVSFGIPITGPNAADFAANPNCVRFICDFGYLFTPSGLGLRTATATINVNGIIGNVALSGNGISPGPSFTISPYANVFQSVGLNSLAMALTLTNNGSVQLLLSGVSVTGADASDFAVTNQCTAAITTANTCNMAVTFTPSQVGTRTATLTVTDSTSGIPRSISLSGTGLTMIPAITPNPVIFGNIDIGLSTTQTVTITAPDGDPVNLTNLSPASGFFASSGGCAIQTPCQVTVTFEPTVTGSLGTTFLVTDVYSQAQAQLNVTGTGGVAKVSLSTSSLSFAARDQGTTSIPQTVTLTNVGDIGLIVSGITLTGANTADFPIETNTCTSQLAPNTSCAVSVSFSPMASGVRNANLVIQSNAASSPDTVQLSGTGN